MVSHPGGLRLAMNYRTRNFLAGLELFRRIGEIAEANQEVIGASLIEVEDRDGVLTPIKMREAIRAKGPTVRKDLGKQAGN